MSSEVFGVGKIFQNFYRSKKVESDITLTSRKKIFDTPVMKIFGSLMPQKKYSHKILETQKSIKYIDFVDFIYKITLRLSLFLLVFIFYVGILEDGFEGGVLGKIPKSSGVGLTPLLGV